MQTSPATIQAPELVRRTLLANAIFSALSGAVLLAFPMPLAPLFGLSSGTILVALGLGLLPFAALVGSTTRQVVPDRGRVLAFALADAAWVAGSILLLVLAWDAIPFAGRGLIIGVAVTVEVFASLQFYGARPAAPGAARGRSSLWRTLALSWLSMKVWVKSWLFFLNATFLLALAFPPQPLTRWVLLAYVASGPLLLGMMISQRGLTRLLGVAHLIPWTPLAGYLVLRLGGETAGPRLRPETHGNLYGYALVLLATVLVCLAADAYDALRWLRGERFVLGTAEAARRGASRQTLPQRLREAEEFRP